MVVSVSAPATDKNRCVDVDETTFRSPSETSMVHNQGCLSEQFHSVERDLMAREAKRTHVEDRLNRLRQSLNKKLADAYSFDSAGHDKIVQSRQEEDASSYAKRKGNNDELSLQSSSFRNNDVMMRQQNLPQMVEVEEEEYKIRCEQVRNLAAAMQEKEELVDQLQGHVHRLEHEQREQLNKQQAEEELHRRRKTAMEQMEERVQTANDEQIDYYEFKLQARDKQVHELQRDLSETRRKSAELDVQLQVNNFKCTSYEKHKKQIDREALDKICEDDAVTTTISEDSEDSTNYYVRKLVSDLDAMENLYIRSKIKTADEIFNLDEKCKTHEATVVSLRSRLAAYERQENSFHSRGSQPTVNFLEKRMEILATENIECIRKSGTLKEELDRTRAASKEINDKDGIEMRSLRVENGALLNRISALEIEMELAGGNFDESTRSRRYKMLEKSLDEYIVEITSLEDQLRMKDKIISRLSSDAVEKRIEIHLDASPDGELETKLSSKTISDETEFSSASDLQSQVSEIQEQLSRRDETLKYVRAKFSAKVARLKLKAKNKARRGQKTVIDLYFV